MDKGMISQYAQSVKQSAIRKIFNISGTLDDVVNFGIGEPDFDTPAYIVEAAEKAMNMGYTHYTENAGLPELRELISVKLKNENNITADPKGEVLVTCGGMGGLYLALRTLLDEGDEVIVPQPAWVNYVSQISLSGAAMVPVWLEKERGFSLTADMLAGYITEKTKVLLLNTPCNPTGRVIQENELRKIARLAGSMGIYIICDEVYEKFIWEGNRHFSIASIPEARERTITVNSLSKSFAMTGWRIGFAAGNEEMISNMTKLQENIYACPSSISQKGAEAALGVESDDLGTMISEYSTRREVILRELSAIKGLRSVPSEGSFYIFAEIPECRMTSEEFALKLLTEEKVAVVPGSAFGESGEGFIRISFTASEEKIREGIKRIKRFLSNRM